MRIYNLEVLKLAMFGALLSFLMLIPFLSFSQDSSAVLNPYVVIKQDAKIPELLAKYASYNSKKEFVDGYRIQIMYTDVREEAYKNKGTMYKEFPELSSYIEYEQPYYKLRLGDFNEIGGHLLFKEVVTIYNGAFIVKDKIKIR